MYWIGAAQRPSADGRFLLQPYRLSEAGIELGGEPLRLHGPSKPRRRPIAALDGSRLWAATRAPKNSKPVVTRFDFAGVEPPAIAPLAMKAEKFPAALAVYNETCFLGWNAEVHAVRVEHGEPRTIVLACPGCPDWKPFDVFCVIPPLIFAVDDVIQPKWRMCIDSTRPESPVVLWGHEFDPEEAYAEYRGATECGGRVVLWSSYANTYSSGQYLELVAVSARGVSHVADVQLRLGPRAREGDRLAVLEEHRFAADVITAGTGEALWAKKDPWPVRRTTQSNTLDDCIPFSNWTGLAAVGDQVFVGAGPQGLLRFRVEERGFSMLPQIHIGECLDVVSCGSDIVVLVRDEQRRRVLQLRPDAVGGLRTISEVEVDERVCKLVGQSG